MICDGSLTFSGAHTPEADRSVASIPAGYRASIRRISYEIDSPVMSVNALQMFPRTDIP